MAELVDLRASDPRIRRAAIAAIQGTVARDVRAQIAGLRAWLLRHCHFVPDPLHDELLIDPPILLADIEEMGKAYGDCDDAAVLAATLGTSLGIPARFVVVPPDRELQGHVWTQLFDGAQWVDLDVTRPPGVRPITPRQRWIVPLHLPGGARAGRVQVETLGEVTDTGGTFTLDLDAPLWFGLDTRTWLIIGSSAAALLLLLRR